MKLRNMKLALSFGIVLVCMFVIATTVCLVGRKTCFPDHKAFKASIIGSLERLLFQQEVDSCPADYEEDAHALTEGLNHHIWEKSCLTTIERLCNFPIFPWAPKQRQFTHRTEVIDILSSAIVVGHRLFGFLLPDSTDEYQFAVASNGYAEVWLSWNKNWREARQIAFAGPFDSKKAMISKWNFGVSEKQVSSTIHLKAGARYYFEILFTYGTPNNNSETFLQVAWKRLEESNFKIIEGASLALFTNDSQKEKYKIFDDELPDVISCATKHQKGHQNKHMKPDPTPYLADYEEDAHALTEGLNHHIWEKSCLNTIERLCNFPIFPWAPDQRQFTHRTEVVDKLSSAVVVGHRLFGFLLPDSTDEYQFAVASNGYAEVWLSWNKNWREARQIAFAGPFDSKKAMISKWNFGVSEKQVSSTIHLKGGARYYFEILFTYGTPNNNSETFLQVAWKRLEESNFKIIEGASLALFTNDSQKEKYKIFDDELPDVISCATKHQKGHQNKHMKPDPTPYLAHTELDKALQKCEYRPSYLLDAAKLKDFKRYQGVIRNVQKTYSFPFSNVGGIVRGKEIEIYDQSFCAERVLNVQEAWSVVKRYMDALEMSYSGYEGFAC